MMVSQPIISLAEDRVSSDINSPLRCTRMTDESESSFDVKSTSALEAKTTSNTAGSSLRRLSFALYETARSPAVVDFSAGGTSTTYCADDDGDDDSVSFCGSVGDWTPNDWGEVDSVYSDIPIRQVPSLKSVRFDCVKVREYALTIGLTPVLDEHQCPLELSWTHFPIEHVLLLSPLGTRSSPRHRSSRPRRLSLRERQMRLMESHRHAASWSQLLL
jgi:hypothetical protein